MEVAAAEVGGEGDADVDALPAHVAVAASDGVLVAVAIDVANGMDVADAPADAVVAGLGSRDGAAE